MSVPDFGKAASDYAQYRQGFPELLYDELHALGVGLPDQAVLDLGTGTGLMAREMACRGCRVTALDPSEDLLKQSRASAQADGLRIEHVHATAEDTMLPSDRFDAVTAATCWHWFDRPRAARECLRLLKPGGKLAIAHQDWLRRPGNVIDATLQVIDHWNPAPKNRKWTFQYPDWLFDLTDAGFGDYRLLGFPADLTYTQEAWVGRIVASAQIGPVLSVEDQARFRVAFAERLARSFPDPMTVPHRIFAIVLEHPDE
ncbi:MAG: class I SAM-dependent methyltransferase [Pseudomonadota bacterium]